MGSTPSTHHAARRQTNCLVVIVQGVLLHAIFSHARAARKVGLTRILLAINLVDMHTFKFKRVPVALMNGHHSGAMLIVNFMRCVYVTKCDLSNWKG